MEKTPQTKLATSLLLLRVGIFIVFLFWGLDKILVPEHATKVLSGFYGIDISDNAMMALGVAQLGFLGAFVVGMWKKYTYGAVLVLHAGSTFSSFAKYMDPFNNLLFFASWPMLAACVTLFLLRDYDTYSVSN
ncbi:hypothetical protein ACPV5I_03780 [Vibrio gigantis]